MQTIAKFAFLLLNPFPPRALPWWVKSYSVRQNKLTKGTVLAGLGEKGLSCWSSNVGNYSGSKAFFKKSLLTDCVDSVVADLNSDILFGGTGNSDSSKPCKVCTKQQSSLATFFVQTKMTLAIAKKTIGSGSANSVQRETQVSFHRQKVNCSHWEQKASTTEFFFLKMSAIKTSLCPRPGLFVWRMRSHTHGSAHDHCRSNDEV